MPIAVAKDGEKKQSIISALNAAYENMWTAQEEIWYDFSEYPDSEYEPDTPFTRLRHANSSINNVRRELGMLPIVSAVFKPFTGNHGNEKS